MTSEDPKTTSICPTCRRPMPVAAMSVNELLRRLAADPRRDVYAAQAGGYFISYSGGRVDRATILAAEAAGLLRRRLPHAPELETWVLA